MSVSTRSTGLLRTLLAVTVLGAGPASASAIGADGSILVATRGLPAGAAATFRVRGPGGFARELRGALRLDSLRAGRYTVLAAPVAVDSFTYAPAPDSQEVVVVDGEVTPVDVMYRVSDAALAITMTGLPAEAHPGLTLTGPGGYRGEFTGPAVRVYGLAPGSYTIEARPAVSADSTYAPIPASQMRLVVAGRVLDVSVNYGGGPALLPVLPKVAFAPGYHDRVMLVDSVELRYKLFIPVGYDPSVPTPVVLFAHGSGEVGENNRQQLAVGLGPWLATHALSFPAVVIFPQQPPAGVFPRGSAGLDAVHAMFMAAIDSTLRQVNVDTNRIYMTGVSLGGFRTWGMAYLHPHLFAAIAPVAGGLTPSEVGAADYAEAATKTADRLRDLPIWMWHGDADPQVSLTRYAEPIIAAFAALPPPTNFRYIIGRGLGHALEANYNDPNFWAWLFAQHR